MMGSFALRCRGGRICRAGWNTQLKLPPCCRFFDGISLGRPSPTILR